VNSLTAIPTICASLASGEHILCTYVWADEEEKPTEYPHIVRRGNQIIVCYLGEEITLQV
jgi:hypothetical protein